MAHGSTVSGSGFPVVEAAEEPAVGVAEVPEPGPGGVDILRVRSGMKGPT